MTVRIEEVSGLAPTRTRLTARIGLLVPSINTVVESDMYAMAPEGIGFATTRLPRTTVDNSDEAVLQHLDQIADVVDDALGALPLEQLTAIAFCCTGASFYRGGAADEKLAKRIESLSHATCTTTSRAAVEGLRRLGAKRLGVATPYVDTLNRRLVEFLEENGFAVVSLASLRSESAYENANLSPETIAEIVQAADHTEADAILVPCTNLPVVELIAELERRLRKPIVSANQATLWHCLRQIGIDEPVRGYGSLFEV